MPRIEALGTEPAPVHPVLARLLWQGLALGLLAIAVPAMFNSPASATLSFWLLAAPAAALLTLYRQVLATAWRARLVRATPPPTFPFGRPCAAWPGREVVASAGGPGRRAPRRRTLSAA